MTRHVLVTNDFPPKIGGIQNYLWELWRRLPPDTFAVYTTPHAGAATFDANQPFPVERSPEPVIGPYPWLVRRLDAFAAHHEADLVLLDPAIPLGVLGPRLDRPYGVVLHGAEVTVPGRLPITRQLLGATLRSASLVVAAGGYALAEAERTAGRALPSIVVPPGVDGERFHPAGPVGRCEARAELDIPEDHFVVATVNRLVRRKGMDVLILAAAELRDRLAANPVPGVGGVTVVIGGTGRDADRLQRLVSASRAPVRLVGRLSDDDVVRLYQAADAMAMLCHDRWLGLEQEGFGIVFLEAAAVGIPQVAGRSGGAHEAVVDGTTGYVVDDPRDHLAVADRLEGLARDPALRRRMGTSARSRAVSHFDYGHLANRLREAIDAAALATG